MTTAIRSREDFDKYLAAFNSSDFDSYSGYYASNAVMGLGNFVIRGRDDIMRFFRDSRQRISEHIDPVNVIITPGAVAVTAIITFTALVNLEEVSLWCSLSCFFYIPSSSENILGGGSWARICKFFSKP